MKQHKSNLSSLSEIEKLLYAKNKRTLIMTVMIFAIHKKYLIKII